MSLTGTVPILLGLGARILYSAITRPSQSLVGYNDSSATSDCVVQGLFQGALSQYVYTEFPTFAPALALGLVARAILDVSSGNNAEKISLTLVSALAGAAASYAATIFADDLLGGSSFMSESALERDLSPRSSRRRARQEHVSSRLRQLNRGREPSLPRRDMSFHTDETTSSMELAGYTGLGRLIDLQLANLRKRAALAEADKRRCKEEKKWALAQGNKSRASQLSWQIKRYAAMAESYTREADRRIIEAARASGSAPIPAPIPDPLSHQRYEEDYNHYPYADDGYGRTREMNMHDTAHVDIPYQYQDLHHGPSRKDKGKAPIRTAPAPEERYPAYRHEWSRAYGS